MGENGAHGLGVLHGGDDAQAPAAARARQDVEIEDVSVRRRVLLAQPSMNPPGGAQSIAAWTIEALKTEHDVTVCTEAPGDFDAINRFSGTAIASSEVRVLRGSSRASGSSAGSRCRSPRVLFHSDNQTTTDVTNAAVEPDLIPGVFGEELLQRRPGLRSVIGIVHENVGRLCR